jgi:hypothetical protein
MALFKVAAVLVGLYQWLISAWLHDREVFKKKAGISFSISNASAWKARETNRDLV